MILEYHRPETLEQALALLARSEPLTVPLGGGTKLNQPASQVYAVVDLQSLVAAPQSELGQIRSQGNQWIIGAGVKLASLLETPGLPPALEQCIRAETTYNLRQMATVAGTLVSCAGRSPLAAAMLAMDAEARWICQGSEPQTIRLSELLLRREEWMPGKLLLALVVPWNIQMAYQAISRTPADFPIVAAAVCRWASGRTRVVLAGYGAAPLVVFDGPDAEGAPIAARQAYQDAADEWASAAYRSAMAEILVERGLHLLSGG